MLFIKDLLLWIYWNPFKFFIQKIPAPFIYVIAGALADFLYRVCRDKREKLELELNFVLRREANHEENRKMVQDAFKILICNELEVLVFPVLNVKNICNLVTCSGLDNLDNSLSNGKGAMLLFAHFGANQMVMPAIGYRGYRICQLSAPATVWEEVIPDRKFSRMEVRAMKKRWGHELSLPVTHINIFGSLKKAFLCLKRNEVLGVAIDGGWGKERATISFLGKEALFSIGAVDIARRTGCPVLPTFMVRDKSGINRMIIEPPLKMDKSGAANRISSRATQDFVNRLEMYVNKYPSHYVNFLALRRFMASKRDRPLFLTGRK